MYKKKESYKIISSLSIYLQMANVLPGICVVGIIVSIIAVMAKEMDIEWRIESDDTGATFLFKKLV